MSAHWKPGDVACTPGGSRVMFVLTGEVSSSPAWIHESGDEYVAAFLDPHPLVVIDPEDREQVERLAEAVVPGIGDHEFVVSAFQQALREFANPTPPKPDEPRGVGAVVLDGRGNYWTRIAGGDVDPIDPVARSHASPPWRHRGVAAKWWANLDAVRVLSEGVTP